MGPFDLGRLGFGDCAVDAVCCRGVDAPKSFTSRGSVALDQRGARNLCQVSHDSYHAYCPKELFHTFNPGSSSTSPFHPFLACSGVSTVYLTGSSGSARHVIQTKERAAIQSVPYKMRLKSLSEWAVILSMSGDWRASGQISRLTRGKYDAGPWHGARNRNRNGAKTRGHLQPNRDINSTHCGSGYL